MTALAAPPRVAGSPLRHLRDFRHERLAWQMRLMQQGGDACRTRFGTFPVVLLSSAELAQAVLVENAADFTKSRGYETLRPVLGDGLLTSEGAAHKRQRKLISPGFQHRRVGAYAETMASYADAAQEAWRDGETIDVAAAMTKLTLAIAGKTMFSADLEGEASELGEALTVANRYASDLLSKLVALPLWWPSAKNRRVRRAIARLDETVFRMIAERRASGVDRGDVLSMLLALEEEGTGSKMTDVEVRDEAMTLFLAGHETTANALAWALYLLSRHPAAEERLAAEVSRELRGKTPALEDLPRLPYAMQVFKEAMRLYPPAYIIGRETVRDVAIGPYLVPRRTTVFVNVYGIHRRPDYFPDPEAFDPDRFAGDREKQWPRSSYLPFGGGPRICIGNQFALLEGQLVLAALAQRVAFEAVSDRAATPEPLITLRPKDGISLTVRRRAVSARPGLARAPGAAAGSTA